MSYTVLVVDDDPDIHEATRMSLKRMEYQNTPIHLESVNSGAEAIAYMQAHPDTPVILLDVVMENDRSGLDVVHAIRGEQGNELVRILLRTGQPGIAPEKEVIDAYDIDGYLPKAELTQRRLYTSVRTAVKHYSELKELQYHRDTLSYINASILNLHGASHIEECLQRLIQIAAASVPSDLALLYFSRQRVGKPEEYFYYQGRDPGSDQSRENGADLSEKAQTVLDELLAQKESITEPTSFGSGYLTPLILAEGKGLGFLYVERQINEALVGQILPILAAHAAIALVLY